eukprot:2578410-Rhodomonas_salina.1
MRTEMRRSDRALGGRRCVRRGVLGAAFLNARRSSFPGIHVDAARRRHSMFDAFSMHSRSKR